MSQLQFNWSAAAQQTDGPLLLDKRCIMNWSSLVFFGLSLAKDQLPFDTKLNPISI